MKVTLDGENTLKHDRSSENVKNIKKMKNHFYDSIFSEKKP